MSTEEYLDHLYEHSVPFRLYAEHQYGLTVEELACVSNKPVSWIEEQIEAMRLCLEQQVRFDFSASLPPTAVIR